jgi:hypothetical protein
VRSVVVETVSAGALGSSLKYHSLHGKYLGLGTFVENELGGERL